MSRTACKSLFADTVRRYLNAPNRLTFTTLAKTSDTLLTVKFTLGMMRQNAAER